MKNRKLTWLVVSWNGIGKRKFTRKEATLQEIRKHLLQKQERMWAVLPEPGELPHETYNRSEGRMKVLPSRSDEGRRREEWYVENWMRREDDIKETQLLRMMLNHIKLVYKKGDPKTEGLCLVIRGLTGIIQKREEKILEREKGTPSEVSVKLALREIPPPSRKEILRKAEAAGTVYHGRRNRKKIKTLKTKHPVDITDLIDY